MQTIFWITVALFLVAAVMVAVVVRRHNQMFKKDEDPVPCDDMPGNYEDYEVSERPFFECY